MSVTSTAIDPSELPAAIKTYLQAHRDKDTAAEISHYTVDATVIDDGEIYRGTPEILGWLSRSAGEFRYTTELISAEKLDGDSYVAVNHLEGDFPGGTVDLHFRFTLRHGQISELRIEP